MKILCTGDVHVGRRSSLRPAHHDGRQHSCAAAWEAIVSFAIQHRVDLVAMSGDIIDRDNRYFEAYGPLEQGLRQLAAAGITTYAVAGNHDFDVLPRLVVSVGGEHFRLLGQGGTWERASLVQRGQLVLHVDGWSFPEQYVESSPLTSYPVRPDDGVPVLAILHADLNQARSRYCPVTLDDLRRFDVAVWLLGHIHKPERIAQAGSSMVLYPGSPQAMDPGETGVHGPWIIDLESGRDIRSRQIRLSSIQYHTVTIDLTGIDEAAQIQQRVADESRKTLREVVEAGDPGRLTLVCLRLILTGRTRFHRHLPTLLQDSQYDLELSLNGITASIEKIIFQTRPAIDLARLAIGNDPVGELARVILALEGEQVPAEYQELVSEAVSRLRAVHQSGYYIAIGEDPAPDYPAACARLAAEGLSLLDELLAQKEHA